MALGKASFTFKRTPHVIETDYIFFLSLTSSSSSPLSLSPISSPLTVAGRSRPLRLAVPVPAVATHGEAHPQGGTRAGGGRVRRSSRRRQLRAWPSLPRGAAHAGSCCTCSRARLGRNARDGCARRSLPLPAPAAA